MLYKGNPGGYKEQREKNGEYTKLGGKRGEFEIINEKDKIN